jgi:hypothetical protein
MDPYAALRQHLDSEKRHRETFPGIGGSPMTLVTLQQALSAVDQAGRAAG